MERDAATSTITSSSSTEDAGVSNNDGDDQTQATGDTSLDGNHGSSRPVTSETRDSDTTSDSASDDRNSSNDAGALPRPPDVSPIAALVASLLPGPPDVDCNTQNPCEAGGCLLDSNPCDGSFTVAVATDLDVLVGCTSVSGDLMIHAAELTTLTALQSLVTIGGNLTITGSDALTDLAGLDGLLSVAGDVSIGDSDAGNANLTSLGGLEQLSFVGGTIRIANNPVLQRLDGFALAEHQGSLLVYDNPTLLGLEALASLTCLGMFTLNDSPVANLDGLENLEQLGGLRLSFLPELANIDSLERLQWIPGVVELYSLDALTNAGGLGNLVGVGSLFLDECPLLQSYADFSSLTVVREDLWCYFGSFAGLSNLRAVGGKLRLEANGSVGGLDSIEMVGYLSLNGDIDLSGLTPGILFGEMSISYNSTIEDLSALENVWVAEGLYLTANINLRTLDGFRHTDGYLIGLSLFSNNALTDLTALSGIRAFYDQIVMWGNESLQTFAGLDSVEYIENRIIIQDNAPFADLSLGLESLRSFDGWLVVEDDFDFRWLPQLESVGTLSLASDNFSDLTAFSHILVQRGLWVSQNQGLLSLDGLHHDGTLEDAVHLEDTTSLASLEALRGVTSIGELEIVGNATLTNVDGLDDLTSIGTQLTIEANPALTTLEGLAHLTTLLTAPQANSTVVAITGNASLPQCAATALAARLVDATHVLIADNYTNGVCL